MLNETQIAENWSTFRELINTSFDGERKDRLNVMYDELEDKVILAPASNKEHFHNSFPGGYVDHILRVVDYTKQEYEMWKANGANIDFSEEELIFAAIHHDLGKIGDPDHERYLPNDSQWHREKMGLIYKFNPDMIHMSTSDRSFFLLNHYGVRATQLELIGIRCTDGLYDKSNETYLVQSDPGRNMKTDLVYILHHADLMATRVEHHKWKSEVVVEKVVKTKSSKETNKAREKLFEDIFK